MSKGKRKYKIHATRNGPSNYSFRLKDMNGGPADLVFNKDTDKMRKRDYYELEFHLHNESGCDLKFVDDREKVFSACSEEDSVNNCAPEGSNFFPIVYLHPTKKIQDKLIHVINTDDYKEKFYFGFSFVSRSHGDSAYCDPVGDNQDRGETRFDWSAVLAGMVSGAAAAGATASLITSFDASNMLFYGIGGAVLGLVVGFLFERF